MSHVGVNLGFGNLHENLTDEQTYLGGVRPVRDRDVGVPRAVRRGGRDDRRGTGDRLIEGDGPYAVVVRAIKRGDLYALTHPDWYPMVERRNEVIAAAFRRAADDG